MNPLLLGVPGATVILIAFALNVSGRVSAASKFYLWSNIIGSLLLIAYAVLLVSIPFIVLNIVWVGFAAYELAKSKPRKKRA